MFALTISASLWVKSSWLRAEPNITTAGLTANGGTEIIKNWRKLSLQEWSKGQLISKCIFGIFTSFKKRNEKKSTSSKVEFVRSFLGRNISLKVSIWICLTFRTSKGLVQLGSSLYSGWGFLGSQWDRQLKFSAYASFLISWSLSKFELI